MRFAVAGLGSMGKRRVRDLLAAGHEVIGHDLREDRRDEAVERFGIEVSEDAAGALDADAVVISTPPDQHVPWYERCLAAGLPFFSEASVLTPRPEWFAERATGTHQGQASATWRFHPLVARLHDSVDASAIRSLHHHYAGWLPGWHPWEPYWEFYAGSRRSTCAAREMVPFEAEWLVWILGPVLAVSCRHGRRHSWRTDNDDFYELQLEFAGGTSGTLVIELDQPSTTRVARLAAGDDVWLVDFEATMLERAGEDRRESVFAPADFDFESVYRDEITAFAEAIAGGSEFPKTWAEDRHQSDVLRAAELSHTRRAWVDVAEAAAGYDGIALD
ncbi:MAG: hypothetical protein QOJ29_2895 [Thermoleophilaceae bacterium]|nr:hypothetical protein [Thermoleophilaceae bacterium]